MEPIKFLVGRFQDSKHLGDTPGLGWAAAWGVRGFGVEDLGYLADTGLAQVSLKSGKFGWPLRIHTPDGIYKASYEPTPNGSLMV